MDDSQAAAMIMAPSYSSYSLELLTEYAHTLDVMPIELSRVFADLRELDAVLTSSLSAVVSKIYNLISAIENGSIPANQRLYQLQDLVEEAMKVRPGVDDKVRIATQAADMLHNHMSHLTALATHLPEFEQAMLLPKTRYPHVSKKAFIPPHAYETGRRRRAPVGGTWMGGAEASPQKKRRIIAEEDMEYGKSPRKEKTGESSTARPRARTKKVERQPSPPESIQSSTSLLPGGGGTNRNGAAGGKSAHAAASSTKRRNNNVNVVASAEDPARDNHLAPSSSAGHPSLQDGTENGKRDKERWSAGPSAPPAKSRALEKTSLTANAGTALDGSPALAGTTPLTAIADLDGEVEADADDGRIYCTCNNTGSGEMIGCDGKGCKIEWFHIMCVGLAKAPDDAWYCEDCLTARNKKQGSRAGKKRSGGGRANGRSVV